MKNLKVNVWILLVAAVFLATMTPTALAAEGGAPDDEVSEGSSCWGDLKSAGSDLYQSAKEKAPGWWQSVKDAGSQAVDAVKEHGPEWVDKAQEKGSELIDKGKDALEDAGNKVSGFLDDQQDQFWERTEQQIYGGSTPEATPPADSNAPETGASVAGAEDGDSGWSINVDEATPSMSAPAESQPNEAAPENNASDLPSPLALILLAALCGAGLAASAILVAYGFYRLGRCSGRR